MEPEQLLVEGGSAAAQSRKQWLVGIFTAQLLGQAVSQQGIPSAGQASLLVEAANVMANTVLAVEEVERRGEPADRVGEPAAVEVEK